jgi:hypothetical protein
VVDTNVVCETHGQPIQEHAAAGFADIDQRDPSPS